MSPLTIQNFNSIKVRLKHKQAQGAQAVMGFQFHKGTIKTQQPQTSAPQKPISIP